MGAIRESYPYRSGSRTCLPGRHVERPSLHNHGRKRHGARQKTGSENAIHMKIPCRFESFQSSPSLQGPHLLANVLENIGGHAVTGESPMKVSRLHTVSSR